MKIVLTNKFPKRPASTIVLPVFIKQRLLNKPSFSVLKSAERRLIEQSVRQKKFTGQLNEVKVLPRGDEGHIMLIGLGETNKWQRRRLVLIARRIIMAAKAEKLKSLVLNLSELIVAELSTERLVQTIAENVLMADYEFLTYRSRPENGFKVQSLYLIVAGKISQEFRSGLEFGLVVGEQVNRARELGNMPGGEMTPKLLAAKALEAGRQYKFRVKVLDVAAMKRLKMGAILGVAKGSTEEPRFIIMEYRGGRPDDKPFVFVGKGVTFDTGGLNLKPEKGMNDMHLDMSGGAAVITAVSAVAKLKLPVNLVGLVPAVENMPGSAGYRPGDLLKSMSGKTIEVLNTDAEGRVILADALTYAARYKPQVVIDVATLTGACLVALGTHATGLMTTEEELQKELIAAGEQSGDYVWPLPMWEEYEEEIKGTFGDVANLGKTPYGGAIIGAMFLKQFAQGYSWAHLDIAGPMKTTDGQHLAKGASGVGVRLLIEFVKQRLFRPR